MEMLRIEGGVRLEGEYRLESAKNAVLPILAACVMTDETVTLLDVPDISDVTSMLDILREMGCDTSRDGSSVTVRAGSGIRASVPRDMAETLRASVFLVGPLLARTGGAEFGHPGGCVIGPRPIDIHERGLGALGASFEQSGGLIRCSARDMRGADVRLDSPSVGATENIMMAAALTPGKTVIRNAAREPEIVDLARFLNACGARIHGAGSRAIMISGVNRLHGVTYKPISDRIVAGTLMAACAATGGEICLKNAPSGGDTQSQTEKLRDMGCEISESDGLAVVRSPKRLRSFGQLQTQPHPGFPTDMQALMFSLAAIAEGRSLIIENIFENRFTHAGELAKMGAETDVDSDSRMAIIRGVPRLHGARVRAGDLRGGAALVIAGLAAEGVTEIEGVKHIDRGYASIENILASLGARIERVESAGCGKKAERQAQTAVAAGEGVYR